jgi:DNA-binding transcriptional MocR family regulator
MARYRDIAADLQARIVGGEFAPGDQLPPITALMEHYRVPGLNTIRQAQQLLVDDGLSKPGKASARSYYALNRSHDWLTYSQNCGRRAAPSTVRSPRRRRRGRVGHPDRPPARLRIGHVTMRGSVGAGHRYPAAPGGPPVWCQPRRVDSPRGTPE